MIRLCLLRSFTSTQRTQDKLKFASLKVFKGNTTKFYYNFNPTPENPIQPLKKHRPPLLERAKESFEGRFLPSGYPNSTKSGYIPYISHVILSNCSLCTMNFMITQSLFVAVGTQGPTILLSAALTWALKDGLGLIAGIIAAKPLGNLLIEDIKRWRFNGFALLGLAHGIDLCALLLPGYFLPIVAVSSSIKSIAYICLYSSAAKINKHFAPNNNLTDIETKFRAQIMLGNMAGFIIGLGLSKLIAVGNATAMAFLVLIGTAISLSTANYSFKRIDTVYFNDQRINIIMDYYLKNGEVLSPSEVSKQEKYFFTSFYVNKRVIIGGKPIEKALGELNEDERQVILNKFDGIKFMCFPRRNKALRLNKYPIDVRIYYQKGATYEDVLNGYRFAAKMQENLMKGYELKDSIDYTFKDLKKETKEIFMNKLLAAGWKIGYMHIRYTKYQYNYD